MSESNNSRELVFFSVAVCLSENKDAVNNTKHIDRSTVLLGDSVLNGIFFPSSEIEKAYMSWDRQPINLDHSDKVEDIVGFISEPMYDKNEKKLSVKLVIDNNMPKSNIANGYINSRLFAERIPQVSVGVWMDRIRLDDDVKRTDGAIFEARNLSGDHLAIVSHGACSPQMGCGIGLSKNDTVTIPMVNDSYDYENMRKTLELEIECEKEKIKLKKGD